jgi:hypothetical protein
MLTRTSSSTKQLSSGIVDRKLELFLFTIHLQFTNYEAKGSGNRFGSGHGDRQ